MLQHLEHSAHLGVRPSRVLELLASVGVFGSVVRSFTVVPAAAGGVAIERIDVCGGGCYSWELRDDCGVTIFGISVLVVEEAGGSRVCLAADVTPDIERSMDELLHEGLQDLDALLAEEQG